MIHERTVSMCEFLKIINFCTSKSTIKTIKIHDRHWEKIHADHNSEGFASKIRKEFLQFNETKQPD